MVELASPPSPFLAAASMQSFDNDFDVAAEEAERYLALVAAAMVVAPAAAAATSQQQQRTQPHQPSGIGDSCLTPQQLATAIVDETTILPADWTDLAATE